MGHSELKKELKKIGLPGIATFGDYGTTEILEADSYERGFVNFVSIGRTVALRGSENGDVVHYKDALLRPSEGLKEFHRYNNKRPVCMIYVKNLNRYFTVYRNGEANEKEIAHPGGQRHPRQ